ncbi:MAG: amidase [Alphaproteobacteria bacterium]|nr:amidase [Alphaproteobacteria bacterium]
MDERDPPLGEMNVADLRSLLEAGATTARALTERCLERIAALDEKVNAVLELNPDALAIAEERDVERVQGAIRGPLHGIPVLIKDNIDTDDRMSTTAGSLALVGAPTPRDAFIVERLRAAGMVLLGKTNLSEWANFRSGRSSSGWSSRGGQTRNPYALDRTPGGSSSGSGVAVACGFAPFAIGTETDGSIVGPAAMNGIVGIKPTVGLVSRTGIVPISSIQDTAGPMAKSVADAAALLSALVGADPEDPATEGQDAHALDYTTYLDPDGLSGARIGVARGYCGFNDGVDEIVADCLAVMKAKGAEIIEDVSLPTREEIRPNERLAMLYEFKAALNSYLRRRGTTGRVRTLRDIIAFNAANADTVMPYFPQDQFEQAEAKETLDDPVYIQARAETKKLAGTNGIDAALQAHNLDAIVAPTSCTPWLIDWINGDNRTGGSSTPAAASGYPNITVPVGYLHGLPIGLSLFAGAYQEPALIRLAHAFELAAQIRRPPTFRSHAEV